MPDIERPPVRPRQRPPAALQTTGKHRPASRHRWALLMVTHQSSVQRFRFGMVSPSPYSLYRQGVHFSQPSIREYASPHVRHDSDCFIRRNQLHFPIWKVPFFDLLLSKWSNILVSAVLDNAGIKVHCIRRRAFDCLHEILTVVKQDTRNTKRLVLLLTFRDDGGHVFTRIG